MKLKSYDVNSKNVNKSLYKMRRSTSKAASYSAAYGGSNIFNQQYEEFIDYLRRL